MSTLPETATTSIDGVIDARAVQTVFQPVVELATGDVVGYEALSRGPQGSTFESPAALFSAAEHAGRLAELDWVCRCSAFRAAILAGFEPPLTLFVNVEPGAVGAPCPPDLESALADAVKHLRVMVEVTESALLRNPRQLLRTVTEAREIGWGVVLDDVGIDGGSLAPLSFVLPDVVKVDLRHLADAPTANVAAVSMAVTAYAERTGATIVAEGIESAEHIDTAKQLGATAGQGWHLGRPEADPPQRDLPETMVPLTRTAAVQGDETPFAIATNAATMHLGSGALIAAHARNIETWAHRNDTTVVLASFPEGTRIGPDVVERYARLSETVPLVGAISAQLGAAFPPDVRQVPLNADDPLADERVVVALGPHAGVALVAKSLHDGATTPTTGRPAAEDRYAHVLTHDRELVEALARALMLRVSAIHG